MGEDGHFASLFPGDPASLVGLDLAQPPGCIAVHAPTAPSLRVSLNLPALLQTRLLLLLVTGERKWHLLQQEQVAATSAHLPIHQLLAQRQTPVTVYWSP
jgi:6-phosphogluconolactonase